jgi:hypothetical protein
MRLDPARLTAIVVVFAGCQFEMSCGSKTLNMDKAREFIASNLEGHTGVKPTQVTCPESVKAKKDATFECTAAFEGGAEAKVTLKQTDDKKGIVEIAKITGILLANRLEAAIAEHFGTKFNVHLKAECGPRVRPAKAGDTFTCKATDAGGASGTVTVKVKDADGNVSFKLDRPAAPPPAPPPAP